MSLVAAAVVPSAPLLIPALAAGSAAVDEPMRAGARAAVAELLAADGELVVVGLGSPTGARTGTWDWSGFGVPLRGAGVGSLPLALGVGAWLLDESGGADRSYHAVAEDESPQACAALGAELVADRPVRLLVVGDGSACRTEKAPGHLDPRAADYDQVAEQALRDGDPQALLTLDADLGRELLVAGRAPWQVLAGAAGAGPWCARLSYADAPHGVTYLVSSWWPA